MIYDWKYPRPIWAYISDASRRFMAPYEVCKGTCEPFKLADCLGKYAKEWILNFKETPTTVTNYNNSHSCFFGSLDEEERKKATYVNFPGHNWGS